MRQCSSVYTCSFRGCNVDFNVSVAFLHQAPEHEVWIGFCGGTLDLRLDHPGDIKIRHAFRLCADSAHTGIDFISRVALLFKQFLGTDVEWFRFGPIEEPRK